MKASTGVLALLLGGSLLGNVVLWRRLKERSLPPPAPARTAPRDARVPAAAPAPLPASAPELRPAEPLPADVPVAAARAPAPISIPSIRNDPGVLGVIRAQEEFGAFWKDLDRLFKARSKLDEERYAQAVVTAVQDFLGMPAGARPAFEAALRGAAVQVAQARQEHEAAKQTLPPKDKSNPVYQQQKAALDLRYDAQVRSAVDGVKAHLDVQEPRQAELAGSLEKLLKNLVPKR